MFFFKQENKSVNTTDSEFVLWFLSNDELIEQIPALNAEFTSTSSLWGDYTATPLDGYKDNLVLLRVIGERGVPIVPDLIENLDNLQDTNLRIYYDFDDENNQIKLDDPIKLQVSAVCFMLLSKIIVGYPRDGYYSGFRVGPDEAEEMQKAWRLWWERNKGKDWDSQNLILKLPGTYLVNKIKI